MVDMAPTLSVRRLMAWIVVGAVSALSVARGQLAEVAWRAGAPTQALALAPHQAGALADAATALQLAGRQREAIALADAALAREPMNVAALRTLGLAREKLGDRVGGTSAMFLAAPLGWRDVAVQLTLIKAYVERGYLPAALERADALARLDQVPEVTFPIFEASLGNDAARAALVRQMAPRPFWRTMLFYRLLKLPAAQLAAAGSPITAAERDVYLTRLVQVGRGPAALAYWRRDRRVPAGAVAVPWDGGFEQVPPRGVPGAPFQWHLAAQSARVVDLQPGPHGLRLAITPGQDVTGVLVSQTVVLAPGRYRLTARAAGDATGLRWAVRCLPAQDEVPVTGAGGAAGLGAAAFAIPGDGHCTAQQLEIDTVPGDDPESGQVTVDDVAIGRGG